MKKTFYSILSSFVFLGIVFTNPISAETVSPSPASPDIEVVQRDYAAEDELPIMTYKSEEVINSLSSFSPRSLQEQAPTPEVLYRDEASLQNELNYYARESITDEEVQQDLQEKSNSDASFTPSSTGLPYGGNLVALRSGVVSSENVAPYIIIKIVSFTGTKPQSIEFENNVYRGDNRLGAYNKGVNTLLAKWGPGDMWAGKAVTKPLYANDETSYYLSQSKGFGIWAAVPGGALGFAGNAWEEGDILLNKLGREYPYYKRIDPNGVLSATMPDTTKWARVSSATNQSVRAKFNNMRSTYQNYYDRTHGYINWGNEIQIHHIRPIEFGGLNEYSNLIPLQADIHQRFSDWFRYY